MRTPDLVLQPAERAFLEESRRGILVTIAGDGRPRPVPVCFALHPHRPILYTPLDEKPKTVDDPRTLARVRDIGADPRVSLLVDRWDEDWTALAWLRLTGSAALIEPGANRVTGSSAEHADAVRTLRSRYAQYADHELGRRPIIRIAIEHATSWGRLDAR